MQIDHEILFTVILSLPLNLGGQLSVSGADWSWNTFYSHSLPSAESRRAVVSFWCRLTMKYCLQSFSPFRWFKKGSCQFLVQIDQEILSTKHSLPSAKRAVVSFLCRLTMKYFLQSFSLFRWFKKGSYHFLVQILVNRLEDKACPVKVWLVKLTGLTWPQWIDWAVKPQLSHQLFGPFTCIFSEAWSLVSVFLLLYFIEISHHENTPV